MSRFVSKILVNKMINQQQLATLELIVFDFDGVFTDNTVYVSHDGIESVQCWRSDGLGLSRLKRLGLPLYIVSTEKNPVVSVRAEKLVVPVRQGMNDKSQAVDELCTELGVALERTMFVGNDINDIPAFKIVGIPVGVADAYPEVDPYILFRTQTKGGRGAVREICDLVYAAKNGVDS